MAHTVHYVALCTSDVMKNLFRVNSSESMTLLNNALVGGLTGYLSTLASCPIELVICRMQGMLELSSKAGDRAVALRFV
jgi:hypothetical protein